MPNTEAYIYMAADYVSLDFGEFEGRSFLVARDRATGFVMAEEVNRQSSANAIKVCEKLWAVTGLPTVVRSDEGTAFTSGDFKKFLSDLFIRHTFSAPYNHSANGGAEKAVDQVKEILKRVGWKGLQKGLLSLNSTIKQDMTGSSMDLFLGRPTKNLLPGSRARRVSQEELRNQRLAIQQRMQDRKRNSQTEVFSEGQEVLVQDPVSRKWDKSGVIESTVVNDNGSITSFMVKCGNRTYHRNARHLQGIVKNMTPAAA